MEYMDLTKENAHLASTVISKTNPEWGVKRFNYNKQPLNDGEFCSTVGSGSNSSVLFEKEYKFWSIVSIKEEKAKDGYMSLFDNIEVSNEQSISDKDRRRCEQLKSLFESTSKQLYEWYTKFEEASKIESNEMYYIEQLHQSIRVSKKWMDYDKRTDESRYKLNMFSPLFDMLHIEKMYKELLRMFENDIVDYFNKTYSLRVSSEKILENTPMGDIPNYKDVVDYILNSLDGKSFSDVAQQHIIDDFKNTIYKKDYVNINRNCITIQNYTYLEDNWSRGYRLSYNSDKRIATVCMAISHFTGSKARVTPNEIINDWDDRDIDPSKPYTLNSDKADSIRFFKNGRLDIKFVDIQTAHAFYTFFQLNSLGQ